MAFVRMSDALNATLWLDQVSPLGVIRGCTSAISKDGHVLELFASMEGYLGSWSWAPTHVLALEGRGHCLPDFSAPQGSAGRPSLATKLRAGVLPETKVGAIMRDTCALPPLSSY